MFKMLFPDLTIIFKNSISESMKVQEEVKEQKSWVFHSSGHIIFVKGTIVCENWLLTIDIEINIPKKLFSYTYLPDMNIPILKLFVSLKSYLEIKKIEMCMF